MNTSKHATFAMQSMLQNQLIIQRRAITSDHCRTAGLIQTVEQTHGTCHQLTQQYSSTK